jgi:hypothetical protein
MSRTEAAARIMEISYEIRSLLNEAMDLVRENGSDLTRERAGSYWYPHILMNLNDDHGWLGGSMCTMESTAAALEEELEEEDDEEEGEEEDDEEEEGDE